MSDDIVKRLRRWSHDPHGPAASDLMDEAAEEIERLRLTAEERKAVEYAEGMTINSDVANTLRGLLERL